ncbi:MAG: hypothetical protein Devi2KO_40790 [Devosia indica]
MFTGSYDKTIKIWDATKGECVRSFDCSHNRNQDDVRQRMHVLWAGHFISGILRFFGHMRPK